jgi:hypothetical protein
MVSQINFYAKLGTLHGKICEYLYQPRKDYHKPSQ